MAHTCRQCSRVNPADAFYCYFDGVALDGHAGRVGPLDVGKQPFPAPFVFPSGHRCDNFDQLALALSGRWEEAVGMLREGFLSAFLGGLGRADLAVAAREAAKHPNPDQGLDDLLGKLPSGELLLPRLRVEPSEINLGQIKPGTDFHTEVTVSNEGMRLLTGSAVVTGCDWLQLGDGGATAKVFQFTDHLRIPLQVRGKLLRANAKPLEGTVVIDSSGGKSTLTVRAHVPVVPYPDGLLAGAKTPREAASKAKAAPKEAAPLFESGAVARWYESNGWPYPVLGPPSTGLGAVQQFFEALGLVQPPKVEISDTSLSLAARAGESLSHTLKVTTQEARPVYAHAVSDQPWVKVGKVTLAGKVARIHLTVDAPADRAGETVHATVAVTANGQQKFKVEVALMVAGGPLPVAETVRADGPKTGRMPRPAEVEELPILGLAEEDEEDDRSVRPRRPWPAGVHAVPLALVLLALAVVVVRDFLAKAPPNLIQAPPDGQDDPNPFVGILVHDRPDALFDTATRRFGLVMLRERDPQDQRKLKKLTYDELGRSNNVCLMIDDKEQLFGHSPGVWTVTGAALPPLTPGEDRQGERSEWYLDGPKIAVAQQIEVIRGEQTKRLDTCLVRYTLTNRDTRNHMVGLRVLLDTFIGANDGVPFTIPGQKGLCDTTLRYDAGMPLPDFIQALERQDLADPGTVAHLQLKLGEKIEPPRRLTLGAWPDNALARGGRAPTALAQLTGWDVPVLPIHTLSPGDSAVTIYWDPSELKAGQTREIGFSYGLGAFASSEGKGKLAMTVGGSFRKGGEFTVTAYVSNAAPGQTVKLVLPDGFAVLGDAEQPVPPSEGGRTSPVTWKVRTPDRSGTFELKVDSSTGVSQTQRVTIQENRLFD